MSAKLREIKEALRERRHVPVPEVGKWLAQVVAGYFAYHAVPTNSPALSAFRYHVLVLWHRQLCRRSQRAYVVWERMAKLADEFLPKPRVLHPWPSVRFAVRHPHGACLLVGRLKTIPLTWKKSFPTRSACAFGHSLTVLHQLHDWTFRLQAVNRTTHAHTSRNAVLSQRVGGRRTGRATTVSVSAILVVVGPIDRAFR